ncbi:uncharacterized protein LOC117105095 [Anneissia japonica]|uniref:uncharacterized protein LOC117105095 n=1 Tax=Anneissia japonica TaxID=1529436 RepID=UPI00142590CF|nr:uncharacterized protein LOC117105095 [Anneissia japonica]
MDMKGCNRLPLHLTVYRQECEVNISKQFNCQGAEAKTCETEGDCYANPFKNINYELQENNATGLFILKLNIPIPRDEYHWRLGGITIHFAWDNSRRCYYIIFPRNLNHQVFNDKPMMLFVFDCISDLLPNTNYLLRVAASPIPTKNKERYQWEDFITTPQKSNLKERKKKESNLKECEIDATEVIWRADYINITLYGSLAVVEFAIAPPACGFEEYRISFHYCPCPDKYPQYNKKKISSATEKVINGALRNVITLEFINKTNDIGTYQLNIRGSSSDNTKSSSTKTRYVTVTGPTTVSAPTTTEPTTVSASTTTEPTTVPASTTEPTTVPASTTTEPTTVLASTTTEPTTVPASTITELTALLSTTNSIKHQMIYTGLGCIIGVILAVFMCRLRRKHRNESVVVQTYLQDESKSTELSSRQPSISESGPPSGYELVSSGDPDIKHDAITISSQTATGVNIDIVASGSV